MLDRIHSHALGAGNLSGAAEMFSHYFCELIIQLNTGRLKF